MQQNIKLQSIWEAAAMVHKQFAGFENQVQIKAEADAGTHLQGLPKEAEDFTRAMLPIHGNHLIQQHLFGNFFEFGNRIFVIPAQVSNWGDLKQYQLSQTSREAAGSAMQQPLLSLGAPEQACNKLENPEISQRSSEEGQDSFEEWKLTQFQPNSRKTQEHSMKTHPAPELIKSQQKVPVESTNTYRNLFGNIKNTNMPKKLLKMFRNSLHLKLRSLRWRMKFTQIKGDKSEGANSLISMLTAMLCRVNAKNLEKTNIKDLSQFFCGKEVSKVEGRKLMKQYLSQLVFEDILSNDYIDVNNKFSYLRSLKVMEWRMRVSDDSLVTRVQSNY